MAAAEVITTATMADPSSAASQKRKSQIDEIEVDLSLPEPPSKKAKRLIKKGKPVPAKPDSDDEPDDGLPLPKEGKDNKSKRSEHGIWIGNLPFTVTRVELFKWLVEQSGGVIKEENITRVNLPMSKQAGRAQRGSGEEQKPQNKGFAYIDFDAETSAVAAMALTETELSGRKVLIKSSKSFEGRPQKESAATETGGVDGDSTSTAAAGAKTKPTSRKIYVGNLSFQTDEDDVRTQFEKCGEIEWVKIATFEDSGKCKGFGWVKFSEPEAAEWAVKGFVKIREEIETEDDFRDDAPAPAAGGDGNDDEAPTERKYKMRKWWVNRLKGRELKIELAEDDAVRYKKRFGKDRPADRGGRPPRDQGSGAARGPGEREKAARKPPAYGKEVEVSYKTGAVVKPEGKKITFD
ncbi:hypothetical protein GGR56DRAFT_582300 [Xylariaceae sp. FL0804]|nr:hypothetical protein GGR56DRAFT_582300 [Xylariaceae sp. FL0804]